MQIRNYGKEFVYLQKEQTDKYMNKLSTYNHNDETPMSVAEPVMSYGVSSYTTDEFVVSLPFDAMHRMIDFAVTECRAGKGTPHEQVEDWLEEQFGWK